MHMYHEAIASRGSQEVGSCLLKHLKAMNSTAKHLILFSDCCGGQNRNINIVCLLLHIVSNIDINFTTIDQKFMVSGHSYLPNDRDFGSVETARRRASHLFIPDHWYELVRTARRTNPFCVMEMKSSDFFALKELTKAIVNRKTNTDHNQVEWLKMRWNRVTKDKPLEFRYRYSHNTLEVWKTVDLRRRSKGRPVDLGLHALNPLYLGPRQICAKKLADLKVLLSFIPPTHHGFYTSLNGVDIDEDDQD